MKYMISDGNGVYCAGAVVSVMYVFMIFDSIIRRCRGKSAGDSAGGVIMASPLCALMLFLSGLRMSGGLHPYAVFELALPSMCLLACRPGTAEFHPGRALVALSGMVLTITALLSLSRFLSPGAPWQMKLAMSMPVFLALSLLAGTAVFGAGLHAALKGFVAYVPVRSCIYNYSFALHLLVCLSILMISVSAASAGGPAGMAMAAICLVLVAAVHLMLYIQITRGLPLRADSGLLAVEDGGQDAVQLAKDDEKPRTETCYASIYERLDVLFRNERPFLDGDLTIGDVARSLYTNKLYISKAINIYTGRNFCQYVNYFRVHYSMDLFLSDPHLKVSQLAEMSGFHTVASYNMAFRLFMNESPSEWCRRNRSISGQAAEKIRRQVEELQK